MKRLIEEKITINKDGHQKMKLTQEDLLPDRTVDCKTCVSVNPPNNNLLSRSDIACKDNGKKSDHVQQHKFNQAQSMLPLPYQLNPHQTEMTCE